MPQPEAHVPNGQTRAPFAGTEEDASQSTGGLGLSQTEADVSNLSRGNDNNFIACIDQLQWTIQTPDVMSTQVRKVF